MPAKILARKAQAVLASGNWLESLQQAKPSGTTSAWLNGRAATMTATKASTKWWMPSGISQAIPSPTHRLTIVWNEMQAPAKRLACTEGRQYLDDPIEQVVEHRFTP